MNFDKAARGSGKQVLTVSSDVSFIDPRYYQDPTVEVRNVAVRGLPDAQALLALKEIRDSALAVRHQNSGRDTNAMMNAVAAHLAAKSTKPEILQSLAETIGQVFDRFKEKDLRLAQSFLMQTMSKYGGTELHGDYDRAARKVVRETVNGILEREMQKRPTMLSKDPILEYAHS